MTKQENQVAMNTYIQPREIFGFKFSANPEADVVEQAMGIPFTVKPKVVELNGMNRALALARPDGLAKKIGLSWDELRHTRNRSTVEGYLPIYNTIFVFPRMEDRGSTVTMSTRIHENFHALTFQFNPVFSKYAQEVKKAGFDKDPIEYLATKSFLEGIAEWGAIEVLYRCGALKYSGSVNDVHQMLYKTVLEDQDPEVLPYGLGHLLVAKEMEARQQKDNRPVGYVLRSMVQDPQILGIFQDVAEDYV